MKITARRCSRGSIRRAPAERGTRHHGHAVNAKRGSEIAVRIRIDQRGHRQRQHEPAADALQEAHRDELDQRLRRAQSSEPTVKSTIAARNAFFRPRFVAQPGRSAASRRSPHHVDGRYPRRFVDRRAEIAGDRVPGDVNYRPVDERHPARYEHGERTSRRRTSTPVPSLGHSRILPDCGQQGKRRGHSGGKRVPANRDQRTSARSTAPLNRSPSSSARPSRAPRCSSARSRVPRWPSAPTHDLLCAVFVVAWIAANGISWRRALCLRSPPFRG